MNPRPHGNDESRDVIAVFKVVLGDDGSAAAVVHVGSVRFGLAQRLDTVVGNNQ